MSTLINILYVKSTILVIKKLKLSKMKLVERSYSAVIARVVFCTSTHKLIRINETTHFYWPAGHKMEAEPRTKRFRFILQLINHILKNQ